MIRSILLAVYVAVATLGFGLLALKAGMFAPPSNAVTTTASLHEKIESIGIRQFSVPILRDGMAAGYVMVKLTANIGAGRAKALPMKIEDVIVDEAYRVIHAVTSEDAARSSKFDLDRIMADIVERVNKSTKQAVIYSVLIQDIAFIDKKDIRR